MDTGVKFRLVWHRERGERGVREGCTFLPWLFDLFLDNIVREARKTYQGGVQLEAFYDVCG